MRWRVAAAKERFSEVVRAAAEEPQLILNRDRVVAAVVNAETFQAFEVWRSLQGRTSLAEAFAELRAICAEEGYQIEAPPRQDRPNAFANALDDDAL
jgi:glucose-6-phosphate isomerase